MVVFLRAANVGGHQTFRPSAVARELGVVSLGAAGTFVAPGDDETELRARFRAALPFEAELMVCPGAEIRALGDPFGEPIEGARPFLTIMERAPTLPGLPIERPLGEPWEVRVLGIRGCYAFSLWRRLGKRILYPNEVIERTLRVSATSRGWPTVLSIRAALDDMDPSS